MKNGYAEPVCADERTAFIDWFMENPCATVSDIRRAGHGYAFDAFYGSDISNARDDADLPEDTEGCRQYAFEMGLQIVDPARDMVRAHPGDGNPEADIHKRLMLMEIMGIGWRIAGKYMNVVERYFFSGETLDEIGADMKLSRERVRQMKEVGLKKIRRALEELGY